MDKIKLLLLFLGGCFFLEYGEIFAQNSVQKLRSAEGAALRIPYTLGNLFNYWGTPEDKKTLKAAKEAFSRSEFGKLERPAILKVNGVLQYISGAGGANLHGKSISEPYVLKINWNNGK